jgi:hypothetical protein
MKALDGDGGDRSVTQSPAQSRPLDRILVNFIKLLNTASRKEIG